MSPGLFFFASFLLLGGSGETVSGEDLRFLEPLVNLGELRTYVVRSQRFEFFNQGSQPLDIVKVEPSCGCMAVNLPQRRFQPGEKGGLILNVKPTSQQSGPYTWFAKVHFRSGERESVVHLQVEATIRREVSVSPSVLTWNGSGDFQQEVTVTDVRNPPLTVKAVYFTSPLAKAQVVSSNNGVTRISLQSVGAIPPGRKDEILSIYTSDAVYEQLQLPVTLVGRVKKAVAVTPERIERKIADGEQASLVRLRPLNDGAVYIAKVTADHPAVLSSWAYGSFGDATLRIQVDATKLAGQDLNGVVRVQLSQPVEETIVIPIHVSP